MMKRKNRLLAWLTALCLMVSVLAVPAAAASLSDLENAWNQAEQEFKSAQDRADEAARAVQEAEGELSEANAALEAARNEEASDGQDEKIAQLMDRVTTLVSKKQAVETAKSEYDALKAAKEAARDAAKKAYDDAKAAAEKEEEDKKDQETQNPPVTPDPPTTPGTPDTPTNPGTPGTPDTPINPGVPGTPETPAAPTTPGSGDLVYTSSVDFGKLGKGATTGLSKTFTITNRSSYDMTLSAPSVSGYTVSGASGTLAAGSSATVTVQLNSTSSAGIYKTALTVYASFVNGTGSYPFSISLNAEVVDTSYSITVDPTSKDFGKLTESYEEKAAKDLEITVTVENKGASNVRMNGVTGNSHFTVTAVGTESVTLKNGEKASYKIAPKHGLAVGTYTDTITFQTREGAAASFKATVAVNKKVDALTVEPAALNFGLAEEGYAAVAYQTVTVKNNTDGAVILTQPTSYNYEISALPRTTLTAGSSVTLNIRPRTGLPANQYSGVIEINSNHEQARLSVQFTVTRPAGPTSFSDVPSDSTFAADIAYVSQKGLMSGVGNGNFNPKAPITRGQLVTILYRLEGQPAVSGLGFSDVAAGSYCEKAVKWAAATGITNGGTDGLFKPNDPITREQMATFMYRYNQHKGYFAMKLADLSTFPDAGSIASYAKDAMSWANGSGLINGNGAGQLNPSGGANRGQAAAILHRYCVSIGQ